LVELKIIAATIGFIKVDLQEDQLVLSFPPADDKAFYEATEDRVAPFQAIMAKMAGLRAFRAHLKQDGPQLNLKAHISSERTPADRLRAARAFLDSLQTP
jgi:hypothetical protein